MSKEEINYLSEKLDKVYELLLSYNQRLTRCETLLGGYGKIGAYLVGPLCVGLLLIIIRLYVG